MNTTLFISNSPGLHSADIKLLSYYMTGLGRTSNLANLCCGKFRAWMLFAAQIGCSSSFIYHVLKIISWCSQKKMLRVYTTSIITGVANTKTSRYVSATQHPHKTVCSHAFSFDQYSTVALCIKRSFIFPAVIRSYVAYTRKKAVNNLTIHMGLI